MVVFSSYVTPMDREYGRSTPEDTSTNDVGIGVQDIGQGVPMGIAAQNVQGVAAKIKAGAGALEIQFPGTVRGNRQAHTPGLYGKDQRQAMRELAEINEIKLTTHSGFGVMGLAGMDPQSGNFSEDQRKTSVDEIKRAVEFAADTAKGGSVVVHTGEYQRPISEEPWARDEKGNQMFKAYEKEQEHAVIRVVDDRTGQLMHQVRKNEKVPRPIWLTYNEKTNKKNWEKHRGSNYTDDKGNEVKPGDFVDYEGNKVERSMRVPVYNPETNRFDVQLYSWKDFEAEARDINQENARRMGMSIDEYKTRYYAEQDKFGNSYTEPEEAFLKATLEANEGHARGWALQYASGFEKRQEELEQIKTAIEFYEKIEAATPDDEKWRIARDYGSDIAKITGGIIPPEFKMPSEFLKEQIKAIRKNIEYEHQASVSQEQLAEQSKESQQHVSSVKKYALDKSFDSYAQAGIYALDQTRSKHLEKPVVITMENIFPESYGSHPDELRNLIQESRERMAEVLVQQRGYSSGEAKKMAETHIKATLDTGHLNIWRKYWQNDPSKTQNENDENFKRWMLKKTEMLAKDKMIGNVHLTDNFGYQDDHLSPGEGTTPVKEMVKIMKKHGYEEALSIEPGADATTDLSDFHGLMKTWRLFGSPVYGAHGPAGRTDVPRASWGNIQYSYFGQAQSPHYVFGPYSPSQDWTLWTQVPME